MGKRRVKLNDFLNINFRMSNVNRRAMDRNIVEIDCSRAEWLRAAAKWFQSLPIDEQIKRMAENNRENPKD